MKDKIKNLRDIVISESLPYVEGLVFGGVGRGLSEDWIAGLPLAIDAAHNFQGYFSPKGLWTLTKYMAGVATVYADQIYERLM